MALTTVEQASLQISRLSAKLARDVQFRKQFEDIIADITTGTNKRVLEMRALLRSAGFRSPTTVRIFNNDEEPFTVISYNAIDFKLGPVGTTLSFTFKLLPLSKK